MTKTIKKAYSLIKQKKYNQALNYLNKHSIEEISNPYYYYLKGMLIPLTDGEKYELEDSKKMFLKSIKLNKKFFEAYLELAYHYYRYEDNYKKAIFYFNKVIRYYKDKLTDSILGKAKCIEELKDEKQAISFLKKSKINPLDKKQIDELITEFEQIL